MRLSWALVHSRRPEDVQRGIAMLEGVNKYMQIKNLFLYSPHSFYHLSSFLGGLNFLE